MTWVLMVPPWPGTFGSVPHVGLDLPVVLQGLVPSTATGANQVDDAPLDTTEIVGLEQLLADALCPVTNVIQSGNVARGHDVLAQPAQLSYVILLQRRHQGIDALRHPVDGPSHAALVGGQAGGQPWNVGELVVHRSVAMWLSRRRGLRNVNALPRSHKARSRRQQSEKEPSLQQDRHNRHERQISLPRTDPWLRAE